MKRHECPTCGQVYRCSRAKCGSPLVYDCFQCYVGHYAQQLESAAMVVADRFRLHEVGVDVPIHARYVLGFDAV